MLKPLTLIFSLIAVLLPLQGQEKTYAIPPEGAIELWQEVEKAAAISPARGSELAISIFEKLIIAEGEKRSDVKVSRKCDRWLHSFVAFWVLNEDVSFPTKVIVLDALYRSPVSTRFSNLGLTFQTHAAIYSQFASELEKASNAKPTPFSAVISKWSKGLNENQNATLAALISRPISGNWSASKENHGPSAQWIEKTLRKRSEVLADMSLPLVYFRAFRYRNSSNKNAVEKARGGLTRLLTHEEFPPLLRLEIIDAWLQSGHAGKAFSSEKYFDLIRDTLEKTSDPWRDRSLCPSLDSARVLSGISFDKMQEPAAKLVRTFTKTRYAKNDRPTSHPDRLVLSRLNLGKLAVAAEEMDFVVEVIKEAPEYFRSDLKLMLKLASKGQAKIAAALASSEPEDYDRFTGIWFTAEDAANLKLLVPALPTESAYLVECVIASSQDHLDKPPTEGKIAQRLIPLAKRYLTEAPKDDRSRFLLLQGFSRSLGATTLLKAEYEKLLDTYDLKKTLSMGRTSQAGYLDSIRLLECLAFAYGFQLAEGNSAPFHKELRMLCTEPELKMGATRLLHHIFPCLSTHVLIHGVKGEKEADELTGICAEIFKESFSLSGSEGFLTGNAGGLALTMYVLAGKSKEWDALVNSLPADHREVYNTIRKRGSVRQLFGLVGGTLPWYQGYYSEVQQAVVDALLSDEWVSTHEIKSKSQVWELASVFRGREKVIKTISNLPESHPNSAEYLAAIAGYYAAGPLEDLEKYNETMSKARKIAEEKKDHKSFNRYVERHSYHLANNQRYVEAIEVMKLIKREILKDGKKKQVDASLKKWEAAK
jgi:hypothetical protein